MQFKIRDMLIVCAVIGICLGVYNHFFYGPREFVTVAPPIFGVDDANTTAAIHSFFASQGYRKAKPKRNVTGDLPFEYVELESALNDGATNSVSIISYLPPGHVERVKEYNIKYWWTSKPAYSHQHQKTRQQFEEFKSSNELNRRLLEFVESSDCLSTSSQNALPKTNFAE